MSAGGPCGDGGGARLLWCVAFSPSDPLEHLPALSVPPFGDRREQVGYLALDPLRVGRGDVVVSEVSAVAGPGDLATVQPATTGHGDHLRRRVARRGLRFAGLRTFVDPAFET